MSSFTIEYRGISQAVNVYDGKPRKTELLFGCPASPPDGTVQVVPSSPSLRFVHKFFGGLSRSPLTIDVSGMPSGAAVFAISQFAARASDYFTSDMNEVALDERSAYEWGYQGPSEAIGPAPSAPVPA